MDKDMRETWQRFLDSTTLRVYKKGQMLLFQGEAPQNAYVLKSGVVKAYDISEQGDEQLAYLLTPLDLFPFPWLLNKAPTSLYYYEALTNCELYSINRQNYQNFIAKNSAVVMSELERYATKEVLNTKRLTALLHSKAIDKLANIIAYLAQNYGIVLGHNLVKISINLTHQDIANLTGLRRETVAVGLNKLKRKGVIHYSRNRGLYDVDLNQLDKVMHAKTTSLTPSKYP